jgi:hypothetical protein
MSRPENVRMEDRVDPSQAFAAKMPMLGKGELVLRQITGLKADMKTALDQIDALLVDFCSARALDPSFLQLLCKGHLAMDELKKSLLRANHAAGQGAQDSPPEDYFRHVGCMLDCQDSCLWNED